MSDNELTYRHPRLDDGAAVWTLVRDAGTLDLNSSYLYLLLCDQFAETCMLAEQADGGLAGFVTAYRPPRHPETLFVWQVGVAPAARGRGVAKNLLHRLLASEGCRGVAQIDVTVSLTNAASRRLFFSLARELDAPLIERPFMEERHFPPGSGHEAEPLLRIGPLPRPTKPSHLS